MRVGGRRPPLPSASSTNQCQHLSTGSCPIHHSQRVLPFRAVPPHISAFHAPVRATFPLTSTDRQHLLPRPPLSHHSQPVMPAWELTRVPAVALPPPSSPPHPPSTRATPHPCSPSASVAHAVRPPTRAAAPLPPPGSPPSTHTPSTRAPPHPCSLSASVAPAVSPPAHAAC